MRRRGHIVAGALLAFAVAAPAPVLAQASETAVKAAFLPRFARYVTWPPTARPAGAEPFVLCLIGGDPFGKALDEAARGQSIEGRRVVVRRIRSATDASGCHVAFVHGSRTGAGQIIAALSRQPILTVTDSRFGPQRGIIHFAVVGGRVRFSINEAQAAQRQLAISSRLLALAVEVRQR